MSLLGYLIPRIASSNQEPAATQALAYLLKVSPDIAKAFVDDVGRTGIGAFAPGRITAEEQHGDHSPDLTIRDTDGVVRVLVENKFWAGLTEAQPVAYLEALPEDASSGLVFIVPHQRIYGVWNELRDRCGRSEIELSSESESDAIKWVRTGHRILAITSWKHVLGTLEQAAKDGGHVAIQQDVVQLRGLTDQMNESEFLPLSEDEVTDVNVARRLVNYSNLNEAIIDRLEADGIAIRNRGGDSHGYTSAGRYLRLHRRFELWLGVDLMAWSKLGVTPIWSEHNTSSPYSGVQGKIWQAKELFDETYERDDRWLCLPIRLKTGVERDSVIEDAARQMHTIADKLLQEFPGDG